MSKCVDLGLTSTLGVSNFTLPQLRSLLTYCSTHNLHPPTLLQNEFNPLITLPPSLLNFLQKNNIKYQAHTCLCGRSKFLLNHPLVHEISERLSVDAADVLFRYAKKKVGNVIIKSDSPEKVIKNFTTIKFKEWDIAEEDMKRLDGIKEGVEFKGFGEGGTVFSWVREECPSFYD
jgi:diketogulonate reductase-like aldo/keto reductase